MLGMAGGELCLTDTGRLGIICNCHSAHLSVSKFTQVFDLLKYCEMGCYGYRGIGCNITCPCHSWNWGVDQYVLSVQYQPVIKCCH